VRGALSSGLEARAWRRIASSLRSGARGARAAPLVFVVSVTTMAAGLLLLATYLLVVQNMQRVVDRFGGDLRIAAFLEAGSTPPTQEITRLKRAVAGVDGVASSVFITRSLALERLRAELGEDAGVLDGLAGNPLPASFEIEPGPEHRTTEALQKIVSQLSAIDAIVDVRFGKSWVEGYNRLLSALEWIGAVIGASVIAVLAVVVAGTVRLALHTRADEIQIQRLVGATALFVRLPFLLEASRGCWVGCSRSERCTDCSAWACRC